MTNAERIAWIDKASLTELLTKWRFEPSSSPWFDGEVGDHFSAVFSKKRSEVSAGEFTAVSKQVGWDR